MGENCLIIFVRNPEKGKVKTRLAKDFGESETLELYKNFIRDILERTKSDKYEIRVFAWPPGSDVHLAKIFGATYKYRHQKGNDLGSRMRHAISESFEEGFKKVILIGSDVPHIKNDVIEAGFLSLEKKNSVIGPAKDGGYYLIGFNKESFFEDAFKDIEWGQNTVYDKTLKKLDKVGYAVLDLMGDIDYLEDLMEFYRTECGAEDSNTCRYLKKTLK